MHLQPGGVGVADEAGRLAEVAVGIAGNHVALVRTDPGVARHLAQALAVAISA